MSQSWLNVPFRWHGFTRFGCDCVGLIIGVLYENSILKDKNVAEIKKISYGTNLQNVKSELMFVYLSKFFHFVENIKDADLLLVKTKYSPIHFVIYQHGMLENEAKIIHITQEIGKVFQNDFGSKSDWQIVKMFKLRES